MPYTRGISSMKLTENDWNFLSYMDEFWEFDYKKWIFMSGQNKAYRITDFFAPGVRESQPYYQKVYLPDDIHYEESSLWLTTISSSVSFLCIARGAATILPIRKSISWISSKSTWPFAYTASCRNRISPAARHALHIWIL